MNPNPIVPKIVQLVSEKTGIQLSGGVHHGFFISCKDKNDRRYVILVRGSTCNPFIVTLIRETRKRRDFDWLIGGTANKNCTNVAYWGENWKYFATQEEIYQCLTENLVKDLKPEQVANYLMAVKSSWEHLGKDFAQYFMDQYFVQISQKTGVTV